MNITPRDRGDRPGYGGGARPEDAFAAFKSRRLPTLVAVDLGAESCRVSLLQWDGRQPHIRLVHRFANAPVQESDGLHWDIEHIFSGIEHGLRACAELASEGISAIGVDGWGVDYVRLNTAGKAMANPFCYRDERTIAAQKEVHTRIRADRLYHLTGIQILALNTLYQLYADGLHGMAQSAPWVTLPEFILYRLGAKRVSEYTHATHTALLSFRALEWCSEIFEATGMDISAAPPLVRSGTSVGQVQGALASLPAFSATKLIVPACHDTASAIAGIPAQGDDWAFISSGTWSLVGRVLDSPCVSAAAMDSNFSNEGGAAGKINFLKNVNGMWLLRQCMEQWRSQGRTWAWDDLLRECTVLPAPDCVIDVDDPDLLLPGNMLTRINNQLRRAGQQSVPTEPDQAPVVANLIFHSLASRYASVLRDVVAITGRPLRRIYIVGGGSKNTLLNRLTEKATGLEVRTGSTESTTIGNFAIQLASLAGNYTDEIGVTANAVADWAGILTEQPLEQPEIADSAAVSMRCSEA
jgi:rhamnulokinase